MPFHGHDPWDEQYFTAINESLDIDVPCSDHTAYTAYPGFEWLYDRLQICHRQGVRAYPHGIEPAQLPVFSKPITNLWGLSNGAGVLDEWDESCYRPGFFWMPVLRGVQLSTDLVVERGTVRWLYSMRAVTDRAGSFVAWEHVPTPARLRLRLQAWVSDVHPRYSGVWNCETIGDTIIESPLRMSPQFVDLYGREWLPAVADLYAGRPWRSVTSPVGALSHVVRLPKRPRLARCQVRVADDAALRQLRRQVSSIQLTVREGVTLAAHNADAASFRIAVVNGFDPRAVRDVAGLLLDCLEFADVDERVGLPATPKLVRGRPLRADVVVCLRAVDSTSTT